MTRSSARPSPMSMASLFEHCARALDQSLAVGAHGLPLIGTGDWNDGMNRVGELGRGESVWLGWFLHAALEAFVPLAKALGDEVRSARWLAHATALQGALEREGWDGDWYRRGYFDDGTPLGSATNEECRIDSIAQSWSVMSRAARTGARDPGHGRSGRRNSSAGTADWPCCSRRHSTARRSIPVTSRATRPGSGRTAGNTPTRRPGR